MTSRLLATGPAGLLFAASFVIPALAMAGDEALTKGWPNPRAMTESLHDVWGGYNRKSCTEV